jgi:uncharacterized RDD family membrane protein YckC
MASTPLNPYEAPVDSGESEAEAPAVLRRGSAGVPRFLAAQIDHAFAVVLFLVTATLTADDRPIQILPGLAALGMYLGYYFLSEWLLGATPGKLFFKLRVQQLSGECCTASQIAIRTMWRLLEVNPFLLGALPAGIAIYRTEWRQRIGDYYAGTVVRRI